MPRNRVIYNVQDLFIGSFPDEQNISIAGLDGYQILQRINRVQSFEHSINTSKLSESVLGSSSSIIQEYPTSPEVSVDFSYLVNGVNNEIRMGLNPVSEINFNSAQGKNFLNSLLLEKDKLGKNIYLITRNSNDDTHNYTSDYLDVYTLLNLSQKSDVEHPDSSNFGVGVFQNSYLNKYSIEGGVGKITAVNVSYTSDNFLGFSHGNNLNIPYLNLKNGTVINGDKELIIPKSFKKEGLCDKSNLISEPSKIQLNIIKSKENTVNYLNNDIVDFTIDIDITRENINCIGHKIAVKKVIKFPVTVSFSVNMIYQNDAAGSFLDNVKEKETYNVVLELKNNLDENICKYTLLGCALDSVSDNGGIGDNRSISLDFSTDIDFERNTRGIFIEGKVDEICDNITDNNGESVTNDNDIGIQFGFHPRY